VNTEGFQVIDDSDSDANIVLKFGDTVAETLTYDRTKARFQFSAGISVLGHMSGSSLYMDGNATVGAHISGSGSLKLLSGAVISRAEDSEFIRLRDTTNSKQIGIHTGAGSPEAVVTAVVGSLYVDNNSGNLYRKNSGSGNTGWVDMTNGSAVPVGTVLDYTGTTEPTGYLFAYGQAVSRTTYADLFDVVSTTYGVGDGSTTFNLPDLRGRTVAGQDDMGGTSANRLTDQSGGLDGDVLGDSGGAETHTLVTAELAAHTHGIITGAYNGNIGGTAAGSEAAANTITSNSTGGNGAHNNVQPSFILNKIIKY